MPKAQLVECDVILGADARTIVNLRGRDAVTIPEIDVLQHVHTFGGDEDVEVVINKRHYGFDVRSAKEEKLRLSQKYGKKIVDHLFPGAVPRMEFTDPNILIPEPEPVAEPAPEPKAAAKKAAKVDTDVPMPSDVKA